MEVERILESVSRRTSGALQRTSSLLMRHVHDTWERHAGDVREPPAWNEVDRQHALVLVRAMLHAAQARGSFDRREQDMLLRKLGDALPEERQALRRALAEPPALAEHTSQVPLGLEREVYTVSLLTLGPDAPRHGGYLRSLASGLRLTAATCDGIHEEYDLPRS